jgi:hypothetical protein
MFLWQEKRLPLLSFEKLCYSGQHSPKVSSRSLCGLWSCEGNSSCWVTRFVLPSCFTPSCMSDDHLWMVLWRQLLPESQKAPESIANYCTLSCGSKKTTTLLLSTQTGEPTFLLVILKILEQYLE